MGKYTYGYNIVTLTDQSTGRKYRTNGGGYDMVGEVFSRWMDDNYRERYQGLNLDSYHGLHEGDGGYRYTDGACGLNCMERIAEAIGLEYQAVYSRKDGLTNILIEDTRDN